MHSQLISVRTLAFRFFNSNLSTSNITASNLASGIDVMVSGNSVGG